MLPGRVLALMLLLVCSACSLVRPLSEQEADRRLREQQLDSAVRSIAAGREDEARGLLETLVAGRGSAGVTDEALFRLALLALREGDQMAAREAHTLLTRLAGEYPDSTWTRQAASLTAHLAATLRLFDASRESRQLRAQNLQLYRENKELRLNIEKLKNLELELELKSRR